MMIFNGVVCICMYKNTKHVVFDGWKAGMLYIRSVYCGHYGRNNARYFLAGRVEFYRFFVDTIE